MAKRAARLLATGLGLTALGACAATGQSTPSSVCGTYEYVYPDNTAQLEENHFIVLACEAGGIRGWYYGTSDDFDQAREGYLPGFFVAAMDSLAVTASAIGFVLEVRPADYFGAPVPLSCRTAGEIPEGLLAPWIQRLEAPPRRYEGAVHLDSIVLDLGGADRVFRRLAPKGDQAAVPCLYRPPRGSRRVTGRRSRLARSIFSETRHPASPGRRDR